LTIGAVTGGVMLAVTLAALATTFAPELDLPDADVEVPVPIDPSALAEQMSPVTVEQGRVYYVQLCASCHGVRGDGQGEWAYRVVPKPANLKGTRTRARTDEQLYEIISEGLPGTAMIPWKKQLSAMQREQVVAYVRYLGAGGGQESRH
jgi:mono/diheme cytochrome c family protein